MAVDSIYSNSSRITGMFSGLDTDQMVKDMTATQQGKVDDKYRDKQYNEWKSEALESVNDLISDFSNKFCSVLGTNSMVKAATYSQYKTTTLASSNCVTISAADGAFEGKYSVSVSQLAGAATASGAKGISASGELSSSNNTKLSELDFGTPLQFDQNGNISFAINNKTFTFSKDDTLQTMVNTINNDEDAKVTMKYSRLTDSFTIESDEMGAGGSVSIRNISGNAFGSYGVNTPASVTGSSVKYDPTKLTLSELATATGTELSTNSDGKVYFEVNGRGYAYSADSSVQDVMDSLNASGAKITLSYDESGARFSVANDTEGEALSIGNGSFRLFGIEPGEYADGTASGTVQLSVEDMTLDQLAKATGFELNPDSDGKVYFQLNGKGFSFSTDRTVGSIMNSLKNAGFDMTFDETTGSFSIASNTSGADSEVKITSSSFGLFGIEPGTYTDGAGAPQLGAFGIDTGIFTDGAQDAVATINGTTITRTTNDFTIDGVSYTLNDVTENTEHFSVERDYSSTVDAVKEFVTGINELLDGLEAMIEVEDQSDEYRPLTEAEKGEMTEEQIKLWEEKSKSGILYRDSDIKSLITNIKNSIYSAVGGTGMNLASIGITTGSYYSDDAGRLVLDEDALKNALAKDCDSVVKMFAGGNSSAAKADQGFVYQLKGYMTTYTKANEEAVETLEDKNDSLDDDIATLEDKLAALAEKYYNQFAAMETALAKLNNQAGYISQLFSM